jgi:hypothetical protein
LPRKDWKEIIFETPLAGRKWLKHNVHAGKKSFQVSTSPQFRISGGAGECAKVFIYEFQIT